MWLWVISFFDLIICYLQRILNFTCTVRRSPDGKYGALNADGSWSGMVNELIQKRADIGKISFRIYAIMNKHIQQ